MRMVQPTERSIALDKQLSQERGHSEGIAEERARLRLLLEQLERDITLLARAFAFVEPASLADLRRELVTYTREDTTMSIECSECERDLRGGHDPGCSRYRPDDEKTNTTAVERVGVERDVAVSWIPFTERMPPPKSGFLLVTNNIDARDALGKSSHVWLVSRVHTHENGPEIWNGHTLAEQREITAYAEPIWLLLRNLTHWRWALPEEAP